MLTFEGGLLRNVKCSMSPAHGILSIASIRSHHLVKSCDSVSRFEFNHIGANSVDNSCDIVTLIDAFTSPFWPFPILGIRSGNDDFGDDLVRIWSRNG